MKLANFGFSTKSKFLQQTRSFVRTPFLFNQPPRRIQPKEITGVKHVIAVSSNKGGVGKSTTAVNLGLALRRKGYSVGLLDLDVYGPSFPLLLNMNHMPDLTEDKKMIPLENFGIQAMSMGFLTPTAVAASWRGPMLISAVNQLLFTVKWKDVDILVLDLPPGTGDTQISVVQTVQLTGAIIVSTPQQLAIEDVTRGIDLYKKCSVPLIGIVENMSYWKCSDCSKKEYIFGEGGAKKVADINKIPFLGEVPISSKISSTSDKGAPIVISDPDSDQAKNYLDIADKVIGFLNSHKDSKPSIEFV